ncbi:hypothetical protein D9M71_817260 [compost metagenome]
MQPQAVTRLPGRGADQAEANEGLEQLAAIGIQGAGLLQGGAGHRGAQLPGALLQLQGDARQALPGTLVIRGGLAPQLQLEMFVGRHIARLGQCEPGNRLVTDGGCNR